MQMGEFDVKEWISHNRNALVTGVVSSTIVAIGAWLLPGTEALMAALVPAVAGNVWLQLLGVAGISLSLGVTAGGFVYRLGQRAVPAIPESPHPALIDTNPETPAPTTWPAFDREGLIADCKILVIDDSSPDKIAMFKRRGFDMTLRQRVEHNASEPYQDTFDFLFLDMRGVASDFGDTRGTDALPLLRRDNPWLPIVVFTSYPQDLRGPTRERVEDLADDIIKKSLRYDELEPTVIELLRVRRKRESFVKLLRDAGVSNTDAVLDGLVAGAEVAPTFSTDDVSADSREVAAKTIRVAQRVLERARTRSDGGRR